MRCVTSAGSSVNESQQPKPDTSIAIAMNAPPQPGATFSNTYSMAG